MDIPEPEDSGLTFAEHTFLLVDMGKKAEQTLREMAKRDVTTISQEQLEIVMNATAKVVLMITQGLAASAELNMRFGDEVEKLQEALKDQGHIT